MSTTPPGPIPPSTTWSFLLDELCEVQGIDHAVAVSGDGLVMAASSQLDPDHADQVSAITSGLSSLTSGACRLMNAGDVESTVVDMSRGVMIVMAIDDRSILTVLADKQAELGQIVYEMDMLIKRAGEMFIPLERQAVPLERQAVPLEHQAVPGQAVPGQAVSGQG